MSRSPAAVLRGAAGALFLPVAGPSRLGAAVESGIAMVLAIGVPALAGRTQLGLLASTGALSALYLVTRPRRERLRRLPCVQLGLLAAGAAGALASGDPIAGAVVLAVVTAIAAVLLVGFAVGPPGLLFFVLITGVSMHVTAPVASGGAGADARVVLAMEVAGCIVAWLVAAAPWTVPRIRRAEARQPVAPITFSLDRNARIIVLRLLVAIAVTTAVGLPLGLHRLYWVVLAAVVCLQASPSRRRTVVRSLHRVLGTLLGVGVFAVLAGLGPKGVVLAVVAGLLQAATELVVVRHYGLALVFITPLALTIAAAAAPIAVQATVVDRVVDTAVGVAVALAVVLAESAVLMWPVRYRIGHRQRVDFGGPVVSTREHR